MRVSVSVYCVCTFACTLELLQFWDCVSSLFLWHNGLCKIIPKRHNNTSERGDCEAAPVHSTALAPSFIYDWKTGKTWIYRQMILIAAVVLFTLSSLFSITLPSVSSNSLNVKTDLFSAMFFFTTHKREAFVGFSCITYFSSSHSCKKKKNT